MFSLFQPYDDEGLFLVTLRDYMAGHIAYNQIYGPFFYEVMGGVFRIFGLAVSTDNGRIVTLVIWLLASLVGGIAVLALSRNLWLGVAGELLTFHALSALTREPMHPEGLISLMLVSLVALAACRQRIPRASPLLIGSVVAAITLMKINIGAFAALAVAFAFAAALSGRWRRVLLSGTVLALVVAPFLLTAGLFSFAWARELALMVSLSAAAVGVAGFVAGPPKMRRSEALELVAGGAGVTIACLAIAAVGGMRPSDLVDSVAGALKLPQLFVLPAVVGIPHVVWAALSLAAAVGLLLRRYGARASPAIPAFLRIAAGAFAALSVLFLPLPWFMLAFPLAWLAVLPPAGDLENPTDPIARLLLAALAVIGCLELYPVAGTQEWLAAWPLVPVSAITFNDGLRQLRAWAATRQSRSFLKVAEFARAGRADRDTRRVAGVLRFCRSGVCAEPTAQPARRGIDEIASRTGFGPAVARPGSGPELHELHNRTPHGQPVPVDQAGGTFAAQPGDLDVQPRRLPAAIDRRPDPERARHVRSQKQGCRGLLGRGPAGSEPPAGRLHRYELRRYRLLRRLELLVRKPQ
ncbi:MAG TPA: hypothetical protein VIJ58_13665 [Candidatus Dormibacteraeota bacterium]